jgi:lysozyme
MASEIDAEDAFLYASFLVIGLVAWNWWRNNSVTNPGSFSGTAPDFGPIQQTLNVLSPKQVSPAGQAFIKRQEGLRLVKYADASGSGYDIGYGHLIEPGENIVSPITKAEAEQLFQEDIAQTANVINSAVKVELTQNQFDALADFEYSIGAQKFRNSTLLKLLNQGNYAGAAQQFSKWRLVGGKPNSVIEQRRSGETQMFNSG